MTKYRRGIMLLFKAMMTAGAVYVFFYTYMHCYRSATFFHDGNYVMILLYTAVYVLLLSMYNAYKVGIVSFKELAFSNLLSTLIVTFLIYFVMSLVAREMLNIGYLMLCVLVQCVFCCCMYLLMAALRKKLYPALQTIMITLAGEHDLATMKKFEQSGSRFCIKKLCFAGLPYDSIIAEIAHYDAVVLGNINHELRSSLISHCFISKKQVIVIPSMEDVILNSSLDFVMSDVLCYRSKNKGFSTEQLVIKRLVDIFVSTAILIITSPVMLIVAAIIKLTDKGPVFYRQTRLTRNGKQFSILKFRSMIVDAEKYTGAVQACKEDPRITKIGKLIRATRIDELPQLINILKGDMTLVGPRPLRIEEHEQFVSDFPQFAYRLRVKAGLTGYAQVYGKYNTSAEDKVKMDLLYIEKASLLLDLQLLFYTLKIVFVKESTEGVAKRAAACDKEVVEIKSAENDKKDIIA